MSAHLQEKCVDEWFTIGSIDEIPLRGARCIKNGDMTIAVFRTAENKIYAIEDKCPHKKGPLSQGIVHDGCVTCPLHNWVISLETGFSQGADVGQTLAFPVKLIGDEILISLSVKMGN
ncbi:MAG: nitrite reductase small subunit NirD [Halopseudomonas aestusnigri]